MLRRKQLLAELMLIYPVVQVSCVLFSHIVYSLTFTFHLMGYSRDVSSTVASSTSTSTSPTSTSTEAVSTSTIVP